MYFSYRSESDFFAPLHMCRPVFSLSLLLSSVEEICFSFVLSLFNVSAEIRRDSVSKSGRACFAREIWSLRMVDTSLVEAEASAYVA